MRISIKPATVDDLPWLRHLVAQFMAEPIQAGGYPAFDADELDAFTLAAYRNFTQPSGFRAWLAWRGKTAIGVLGGELQERLVGKPHRFANCLWVYVAPEYRDGGGIGFRLLTAFADFAESQGITMIEWRAKAGDTQYVAHDYPQISSEYAAPIALVRERWRQHVEKVIAPPPDVKTNGHDTTVEEAPA